MIGPVRPQWLGRLRYGWAWKLQHLRRNAVIAGLAPEACWLLEHDPVVTTGRRAVADLDGPALRSHGIDVHATERGGLATWHGPGQLVGYLIVNIDARGIKVREAIHGIEQGLIDALLAWDVHAVRRAAYPGVWVGHDKIAAIGIHVSRGVTMHGFALNLIPDLGGFGQITPCGITDGGVTTLERITGLYVQPEDAAFGVGASVLRALGVPITLLQAPIDSHRQAR